MISQKIATWVTTLVFVFLCSRPCHAQWYIEAGALYRGGMQLEVSGDSRAVREGLGSIADSSAGNLPGGTSPTAPYDIGSQILRTYQNGYVGPSGWEWAREEGVTQYFGYEAAAQYDAASGRLSFNAGSTASTESLRRSVVSVSPGESGWQGRSSLDGAGAALTLGRVVVNGSRYGASLQMKAGWLGGIRASFRNQGLLNRHITEVEYESSLTTSRSWTYVHDTLGNPSFPSAPYSVSDPSAVAPLISDRPVAVIGGEEIRSARDRELSRRESVASGVVDVDVDLDAYILALGPRAWFRPSPGLGIVLQAGGTLTRLEGTLARSERVLRDGGELIHEYNDSSSEGEWLGGVSVSGGLQVDLSSRIWLSASAGYDWVEAHTLSLGPDRVRLDLSGWQSELVLGFALGK